MMQKDDLEHRAGGPPQLPSQTSKGADSLSGSQTAGLSGIGWRSLPAPDLFLHHRGSRHSKGRSRREFRRRSAGPFHLRHPV